MVRQAATFLAAAFALAAGGAALAQRAPAADPIKARQRITLMESVLERAVMNGADNLLRQVDAIMPDSAMLSGQPQVRGFRLDNYGVFFDVEVPALRVTLSWMMRSIQSGSQVTTSALSELKSAIARMEPGEREKLGAALQRLELALTVAPPPPPSAAPRMAMRAGTIGAQTTARPPVPEVLDLDDPNEAWTREVKAALVDAMLENSNALDVGDSEWLTVAARDNVPADPRVPGSSTDSSTVIFSVKGSDLAALHARRITLDEARQRVQIKEY